MVIINGSKANLAGTTIADYLKASGYHTVRIVIERNGTIVPKASYDQTVLCDGDCIEIVSFVGGG